MQDGSNCCPLLGNFPWEFPGRWNILLARIDYMMHYHDFLSKFFSRGDNRNWTVVRYFPVSFTVHCKYIVVIGWSSLLFEITWGIALLTTTAFLALVLLDHHQHALLKGLSAQRVWHGACITIQRLESASKKIYARCARCATRCHHFR